MPLSLLSAPSSTHAVDFDDGELSKVELDAKPGLDVLAFDVNGEGIVALDPAALIVVRFRLE